MSTVLIGVLFVFGLVIAPMVAEMWQRMSPKTRLLLIAIVVVAFLMLGCDDSGSEGTLWRLLRTAP